MMRKIFVTILSVVLCLSCALFITGCSGDEQEPVEIESEEAVEEAVSEEPEEEPEDEQAESGMPDWGLEYEELGQRLEDKWTAIDKDAYEMIVSDDATQTDLHGLALYAIRKAYKEAGSMDFIVCGYYSDYERAFTYDSSYGGGLFYGYYNDSPDYEWYLTDNEIEQYIEK